MRKFAALSLLCFGLQALAGIASAHSSDNSQYSSAVEDYSRAHRAQEEADGLAARSQESEEFNSLCREAIIQAGVDPQGMVEPDQSFVHGGLFYSQTMVCDCGRDHAWVNCRRNPDTVMDCGPIRMQATCYARPAPAASNVKARTKRRSRNG